jgi:hypothetical protein
VMEIIGSMLVHGAYDWQDNSSPPCRVVPLSRPEASLAELLATDPSGLGSGGPRF